MIRQQMAPLLVSIRRPDNPADSAIQIPSEILYVPEKEELRSDVKKRVAANQVEPRARQKLTEQRNAPDWHRLLEAIWLAPTLQAHGIRHVHAHFGGLAARTAWWLRESYGFTYSYTGHANDIFCPNDHAVSSAILARDAEFIVTETDYARRWMEERYPFTRGKVHRVFNGLDGDGFLPWQPSGPIPRIVSVGRLVEKKGFDVLIDSCASLRQRGVDFSCDIIGDGPLQPDLAAQIERLALGGQVRLLGALAQDDVRRHLASAQVFVLACQPDREGGSDNLPTAIAEAMMAGVPAISTPVAGVPEMIHDGETGLLVPPRDSKALAEAVARLVANPALAREIADRARRHAQASFAIEATTKELKHLLVRHGRVKPPAAACALDSQLLVS